MAFASLDLKQSLETISRHLRGAQKVVLTTHVTPDGDGLGSALALMRFLRGRGKDARLINCSATPNNLRFLVRTGEFSVWMPRKHQQFLDGADVIVATDIGGAIRLGKMEGFVRKARGHKVVIDHHLYENDMFDLALIAPAASSSSEIVYDLILHMGGEMTPEVAEPLYVGIVSDTGNFCYTSTSSRAHRIAATLLDAGVNPHHVWRKLSCQVPWPKMKVLGLSLASLHPEADGRVVWTSVNLAFLQEHGLPARDAFEVVNYFLQLKDVEVGALFMEITPSKTKVSLRSAGRVDVCKIASGHGGGGHRFAAGCTVDGMGLDEARAAVLEEVLERLGELEEEEESAP